MGHYEDSFFEIYQAVATANIKVEFNKQVEKMKTQDKHRFKSTKEVWEYAYHRITSTL
jgi:hypothetical protein